MIRLTENASPASSPRLDRMVWLVGILFGIALVALLHDRDFATANGAESVEAGRGLDEDAVVDAGLGVAAKTRVAGLVGLMSVGGICFAMSRRIALFRPSVLTLLIAVTLLWTVSSLAWSADRDTSLRELMRLVLYMGVAAALARRFDPRSLCFVLAIALGVSASTAVGYEIVTGGFRPWDPDFRLTGTLHSNMLAVQAAVVAVIAYSFAYRGTEFRAILWAVFLAALAVVVLTKARTALVTVFAGISAVHWLRLSIRDRVFYGASLASVAALVMLAATSLGALESHRILKFTSMGRKDDVSALTGRVPLWEYIWQASARQRLQGFGYGAFWLKDRTLDVSDDLEWFPHHSHNAYIETMVNSGLIGLSLLLAVGVTAFWRATRLAKYTGTPAFSAMAAVLIAAAVNGSAETAIVLPRDMAVFVAAIVFSIAFASAASAVQPASTMSFVARPATQSRFSPQT